MPINVRRDILKIGTLSANALGSSRPSLDVEGHHSVRDGRCRNRRWRETNFHRKCWEREAGSFLHVVDDGRDIWSQKVLVWAAGSTLTAGSVETEDTGGGTGLKSSDQARKTPGRRKTGCCQDRPAPFSSHLARGL